MRNKSFHGMKILVILLAMSALGGNIALADENPSAAADDGMNELMVRTLAGASGREIRMITVAYPPGSVAAPPAPCAGVRLRARRLGEDAARWLASRDAPRRRNIL